MRNSHVGRTLITAYAPVVWGTTYVVTTELLPAGHPMFAGLMRALPAGLLAIAATRGLPRGGWWLKAATLGVLNIGMFFPLLFLAAERLPGGVAATLGAAQPMFVAVGVVIVLRQPAPASRFAWGLLGLAGIALVVIRPDAAFDPLGVAAGLGSAVSMACGVILTKRWGRPAGVSATTLAGWQLSAGGLFLLPLTLLTEGLPANIDANAVAGYLWLGLFGGLLAYALFFRGIASLPVSSVAFLTLLSPLVAATLGALLLGQLLGPWQLLGFALALTAIAGAQLPSRKTVSAPSLERVS